MTDLRDVNHLIYAMAKDKLFDLFRQGLMNGAAIPEITTEAEMAAHHMLGCNTYTALMMVYGTALTLRDEEYPQSVVEAIMDVADVYLRDQTDAVVAFRGPIGSHDGCGA